jgi:hypothetical protein
MQQSIIRGPQTEEAPCNHRKPAPSRRAVRDLAESGELQLEILELFSPWRLSDYVIASAKKHKANLDG